MALKKPGTRQKKESGEVVPVAVGDVGISRTTPGEAFARVLGELKAGGRILPERKSSFWS
jgi:hypothetical protein